VVVGAGPNGLTAAITLARHGLSVVVCEAAPRPGGGMSSAELTLPGFTHDVCSTVHAFALASPVIRAMPLAAHGLRFAHPPIPFAHPLDGGRAAVAHRDLGETAAGLGRDAAAHRRLWEPLVRNAGPLFDEVLAPPHLPRHPLILARFGLSGVRSAAALAKARYRDEEARALLAGCAAHSMLSLRSAPTAGFALMLGVAAHAFGWPVAAGGSQALAAALAGHLRALGGEVRTGCPVARLGDLPPARVAVFDVTPRQLIAICGGALPARYVAALRRFRYGAGVFKMDWALDGPVPWTHPDVRRAGTIHVGGTLTEIAQAEAEVQAGRHPRHPYVLAVQPTVADRSRAPAGKHVLWAYTHVPNGSAEDVSEAVERQIERFAPGFRDLVLARSGMGPADMERRNPNLVGGDINGGVQDLAQHFMRPALRLDPYATPNPSIYLCSASTPPGGGVHGMGGYWAARTVLRRRFGVRLPRLSPAGGAG